MSLPQPLSQSDFPVKFRYLTRKPDHEASPLSFAATLVGVGSAALLSIKQQVRAR